MNSRRAQLSLDHPHADILRLALSPEAGREIPRARVSMATAGGKMSLTIEADDTSALRAALNSYVRWAKVALDVVEEATQ